MKLLSRTTFLVLLVTAAPAGAVNHAEFAQQMLAETNLARTNPRSYANHLREMRGYFEGKLQRSPRSRAIMVTKEGLPAVDEAIAFLEKQPPLPALKWSSGLAEAAADLAREQGLSGDAGHSGRRSGGTLKRLERHGDWFGSVAENIAYGPDTPRDMVIELIVDDGVTGRGHRKNIFTKGFTLAGASCGPHPKLRYMCVMDFAARYKSRGKK